MMKLNSVMAKVWQTPFVDPDYYRHINVSEKVSAQVYSEVYEKIKVVLDRHTNP